MQRGNCRLTKDSRDRDMVMPENTGGQNKQMEEMVAAGIAARDANREKSKTALELKRKVELAAKKKEK